jgi:hypothetical protein
MKRQKLKIDPSGDTSSRRRSSEHRSLQEPYDNTSDYGESSRRSKKSRSSRTNLDEEYRPPRDSISISSHSSAARKRRRHQLEEEDNSDSNETDRRRSEQRTTKPFLEGSPPLQTSYAPPKKVSKTRESSNIQNHGRSTPIPQKRDQLPIKIYLSGVKGEELSFEQQEVARLKIERQVILVNHAMSATHFVLSDDPQRTKSAVRAIACGKWVLRYKWYSTLMRLQTVPDESEYEFQRWPGTRLARIAHQQAKKLEQEQQQRDQSHGWHDQRTSSSSPGKSSAIPNNFLFASKSFNVQNLTDEQKSLLVDVFGATGATIDTKSSSILVLPDDEWNFDDPPNTWHSDGRGAMPFSYILDCIQHWERIPITAWHSGRFKLEHV